MGVIVEMKIETIEIKKFKVGNGYEQDTIIEAIFSAIAQDLITAREHGIQDAWIMRMKELCELWFEHGGDGVYIPTVTGENKK